MYHEQNLSQQGIARRLGVSRSTVSRFLRRARELGVVHIQVVPPNRDPALSERLARQLGLRAVHIAPGRAQESEPGLILAEPLARALDETRLLPGEVALVAWGRAVASVGRHLPRRDTRPIVVPAMGGYASDEPWFQPNEIVRSFALALNGQPRVLNAPAVVSPGLARALRVEAETRSVMDLWDRATLALVGVGAWPKPGAGYAAAGFPFDDPAFGDAVGDVAGIPYTADGRLIPWPPSRQLLGVTPEHLRRIPHVICLAGGESKAHAAVGAARAGLIDVLVTDAPTARAIAALSGRNCAEVDATARSALSPSAHS
jgi:DNA-binding transcriptional regulator LsrR (DeoR family)